MDVSECVASPLRRLGAFGADVIVYGVVLSIAGVTAVAVPVLALLIYVAFLVVFISLLKKGQTPGKFALGIRVYVADSGEPAGFWLMLVREVIGKWISGLVFMLGWAWILFDARHQGWHDKLVGTVVADEIVDAADVQMAFSPERATFFFAKPRVAPTTSNSSAGSPASNATQTSACECCGQWFAEATRRRPAVGKKWGGVLEVHHTAGVCPVCHNTYGTLHEMERDWIDTEWLEYATARVREAATKEDLASILLQCENRAPGLEQLLEERLQEIESAGASASAKSGGPGERTEAREVCVACGRRVTVSATNVTERGVLCDDCFLVAQL